jgi:serine/threonine protein kinase
LHLENSSLLSAFERSWAKFILRQAGYRLGKLIGSGSTADVHQGLRVKDNTPVAIKIVPKQEHADINLDMIKCEIKAMQELQNHPHVVSLIQVIEDDQLLCVVETFGSQGDLYEYLNSIDSTTGLPEDVARIFFQQLVEAVNFAHQNGIAHRDLKLENVFLDGNLQLRLGDFGLCRFYKSEALKTTNKPVGTLSYAAPEIVNRENYIGPEVDIWSLGVILFELLTGFPPFSGASRFETVIFIRNYDWDKELLKSLKISPEAYDLLDKIFKPKSIRIDLKEIQNHAWMSSGKKKNHTTDDIKNNTSPRSSILLQLSSHLITQNPPTTNSLIAIEQS